MNRISYGAMCVAVGVFIAMRARRARQGLGPLALEKMESVFGVVESLIHAA